MGIIKLLSIILIVISALYLLSFWAGSKKGDKEKLSVYENGFNPIGDAKKKIDILFWIIGLLYLIFDLEIVFIFPFISVFFSLNSLMAYWTFIIFLIILALGFVYEFLSGALKML